MGKREACRRESEMGLQAHDQRDAMWLVLKAGRRKAADSPLKLPERSTDLLTSSSLPRESRGRLVTYGSGR